MIVGRDLEWGDEMPFVAANHASIMEPPCLDVDEIEQIRRDRRAALARKRPAGFTARWDDDEPVLRSVA